MFRTFHGAVLCIATGLATSALTVQAQALAEPTAEGYLYRELFGDGLERDYGIKIDGYMQAGIGYNDKSTAAMRAAGNSNFPVAPGDEGFKLEDLHLHLKKPLKTNILPRISPLPGPMPQDVSFGMEIDLLYGRSGQPAAMFGIDKEWGINRPGNTDPKTAALNRQNFLAVPQFFVQAFFPVWNGIAVTAGRFGAGIGYEIAPQHRPTPNVFYTRSYAYVSQPQQVFGLLGSMNLVQSRSSLVSAEVGVVNGWQNLKDNNDTKSLMGAIRWRSADMKQAVNYAFITGNEQTKPGEMPQAPVSMITSPRGQNRQHHSINGYLEIGKGWSAAGELVYGSQDGDGRPDTVHLLSGPRFSGAKYAGANGILSYRLTDRVKTNLRLEHFRARDGFGLFPLTAVKSDFNAMTFGLNYQLNKYVSIRPEVRHDWQSHNNGAKAFGAGTAEKQTTIAEDVVIRF
ncbi:outer membrane beta-barrel protein [Noviherbaspirillum denitrificans]|uniref:Porin n=1 Tax=Noviherbaspirillum denitrificans TaxID=1968433 RepID=A0A254TD72_9BURK|nr:outer membrane beta-barrel protein [Noviherbaspirillum denitrificans]OWW19262.1 hypothetical protein AYR66_06855 [Noviherbaspirillum denitrificans]